MRQNQKFTQFLVVVIRLVLKWIKARSKSIMVNFSPKFREDILEEQEMVKYIN